MVEGPEAAFYVVYKYFHTYYFFNLEMQYHTFHHIKQNVFNSIDV